MFKIALFRYSKSVPSDSAVGRELKSIHRHSVGMSCRVRAPDVSLPDVRINDGRIILPF